MKTKDLVYIGIIAYLGYLLMKNNPKKQSTANNGVLNNQSGVPVGNGSNGGLNLGSNMDLPNLTPTSSNGLSTEVALNSSNVTPLIRDENQPTQIFGNVNLPTPYTSVSVVNPNPLDVVPVSSETVVSEPIGTISVSPANNVPKLISVDEVSEPLISTNPITPISIGTSVVSEPVFPIKTVQAQLLTNEPKLEDSIPLNQEVSDAIILECGNSFSIPNNDKEGSYTNYWFDGKEYYTQTTSPLIKTIPTKISKSAYIDGCKKSQLFKLQNSSL